MLQPLAAALSRACQYHSCELAATATELKRWLDAADQFVRLIRASGPPP